MHNATPLVFVYQGVRWPKYVRSSLRLASQTAGIPIVVLTNLDPIPGFSDISWVQLSDFYERADFNLFIRESRLPGDFRGGFWFHTVERFFILRDFMNHAGLARFFHGELDCVFLQVDELAIEIEGLGLNGFFFPRETTDRGLGSLVYINDLDSLSDLCKHFLANAQLGVSDASAGNEMHLIGLLPHGPGEVRFHALKSAEWLYRQDPNLDWPVHSLDSLSIVDGAVLGRWLFGMDPANTDGRGSANLIQNHRNLVPFSSDLSVLEFKVGKKSWEVYVRNRLFGGWYRIRVLHVHSKIHRKLTPQYVSRVVRRANRGQKTVIVAPSLQFFDRKIRRILRHLYFLARSKDLRDQQWARRKNLLKPTEESQ